MPALPVLCVALLLRTYREVTQHRLFARNLDGHMDDCIRAAQKLPVDGYITRGASRATRAVLLSDRIRALRDSKSGWHYQFLATKHAARGMTTQSDGRA